MFESREWRKRAPDSPLFTLPQIAELTQARFEASRGSRVRLSALRFDGYTDLRLPSGDGGMYLQPTNWAISQLALLADFPYSYLARLPARVAADCINASLSSLQEEAVMAWAAGEPGAIRRFTPPDKFYNWDKDLVALTSALPAEFQNVVWARISDRNLYVCLTSGQEVADGYLRGILLWNSEVGQVGTGLRPVWVNPTLGATLPNVATRLFEGYEKVEAIGLIAPARTGRLKQEIQMSASAYLRAPLEAEQAVVNRAREFNPSGNGHSATTWALSHGLPAKQASAVIAQSGGRDVWSIVKAGAELSASTNWADERSAFDAKLGRLLEAAL